MSTNSQEQEIDLGQIGRGIKIFFNGILNSLFDFVFFVKKKIIVIVALIIVGITAAFLLDSKVYSHEVAVIPNFESNEYLYKKIEEVDAKLREKDVVFFKELGIKNFKNIISLKIEAYPGVYDFIKSNSEEKTNFELLKLMAEDGSIDKILKDEMTSKNYYHHKITIVTKGMFKKEELITPLLNYLNSNTYFEKLQKISYNNLKEKIVFNDSLSKQIDRLIVILSANSPSGTLSISDKNSIPELVEKKDRLLAENQYLFKQQSIFEKIIKEESSITNIRFYKPLLLNNKILFPIFLILFYFIFYSLTLVFKKHQARING